MKFFLSILFSVVFVTVSSEKKLETLGPDQQKIHLREYKIKDNNGLHRVTRISLSEAKALGIDIEALKVSYQIANLIVTVSQLQIVGKILTN